MKRRVSPLLVPFLVLCAFTGAWAASQLFRIPSFTWETVDRPVPEQAETVALKVRGLECRHMCLPMEALLFGRTDPLAVEGYLKALIFPSPGIGEMVVTFDPSKTSLEKIARAVRLDAQGQETEYRVLLEVKPDLSTPEALFRSLSRAFEERNEDLFRACLVPGAARGVDFGALVRTWSALFLEELRPAGSPDADGRIGLLGVIFDDAIPLGELTPGFTSLTLTSTPAGWQMKEADWARFRAQ